MSKMARNRSALHDVLAQGASNRDITVYLDFLKKPKRMNNIIVMSEKKAPRQQLALTTHPFF